MTPPIFLNSHLAEAVELQGFGMGPMKGGGL